MDSSKDVMELRKRRKVGVREARRNLHKPQPAQVGTDSRVCQPPIRKVCYEPQDRLLLKWEWMCPSASTKQTEPIRGCSVCRQGGRRYRITNVALNSPIQSEDPQSGSFAMRSVDTAVGMAVGLACGMREKNIDM